METSMMARNIKNHCDMGNVDHFLNHNDAGRAVLDWQNSRDLSARYFLTPLSESFLTASQASSCSKRLRPAWCSA